MHPSSGLAPLPIEKQACRDACMAGSLRALSPQKRWKRYAIGRRRHNFGGVCSFRALELLFLPPSSVLGGACPFSRTAKSLRWEPLNIGQRQQRILKYGMRFRSWFRSAIYSESRQPARRCCCRLPEDLEDPPQKTEIFYFARPPQPARRPSFFLSKGQHGKMGASFDDERLW